MARPSRGSNRTTSGKPKYWVVGAFWDDDQFDVFIREGYWLLGWDDKDRPTLTKRRDQIRPGDHIAIKKIIASDKKKIEIRAIGVVKGIDPKNHRVHVRWNVSDLHREVPSKGCYASIHGPFSGDEDWTQHAFQLENQEPPHGGSDLPDLDYEDHSAQEGAKSWRWHLVTERNKQTVKRKKAQIKSEKGSLECEACGFDFAKVYGDLGADFCEVHHKVPLSCSTHRYAASLMTWRSSVPTATGSSTRPSP